MRRAGRLFGSMSENGGALAGVAVFTKSPVVTEAIVEGNGRGGKYLIDVRRPRLR
jgi:hypothetical protein